MFIALDVRTEATGWAPLRKLWFYSYWHLPCRLQKLVADDVGI